uniref:Uncharacterized protein n=1 Tax=Scleropages formosus TaxID=113540 RepID=A0A8C9UXG5_SCLFO
IFMDYIWRMPKEVTNPQSLSRQVWGSVMIWAAISWESLGLMIALYGRTMANEYKAILQDRVYCLVQTLFPRDVPIFQSPHAHC